MSLIPQRRPLPSTSQRDPQVRVGAANSGERLLRTLSDASPEHGQNLSEVDGAQVTPTAIDNDVLILSKAKVEELAWMLLGLVGNGNSNEGGPSPNVTHLRQRQSEQLSLQGALPDRTPERPLPVVSQEILRPSSQRPGELSQRLMERKPWLHDKVIVEVSETGTATGHTEAIEDESGADDGPRFTEGQPLRPSRIQENSLYLLQGNHAWVDLHTHLGPGKFTEEGRSFWLSTRKPNGWPTVVSEEKRERYLSDLWNALIADSPAPQARYSIVSDLDRNSQLSMAYKRAIARNLPRRPTFGRRQSTKKGKFGLLSKINWRMQALSQAFFSTADTARARLPSTSYLRIIGQRLFEDALTKKDGHNEELRLRVLITCLRTMAPETRSEHIEKHNIEGAETPLQASGRRSSDDVITFWDLLAACYRAQILQQPADDDNSSLCKQLDLILDSLQLVNMFTRHLDKNYLRSLPLDELLSSSVESICAAATLRRREPVYPSGGSEYFGKKGFNIKTLQDIGALNIYWTRYIDEHLSLDTHFGELRVFWPAWALANLPSASIFAPGPDSTVLEDLLATYKFLFYSPAGVYSAISEYKRLDAPSWLSSMSTPLTVLSKGRPLIGDMRYHFASYEYAAAPSQFGSENTAMMRFDACGMFENRLRILRTYMDSQKPSGLLALWRDKRDSGQWYTFWLVCIVGGISILLALASLAVSIAQTAASFEALHLQIHGAPNTSNRTNSTTTSASALYSRRGILPLDLGNVIEWH